MIQKKNKLERRRDIGSEKREEPRRRSNPYWVNCLISAKRSARVEEGGRPAHTIRQSEQNARNEAEAIKFDGKEETRSTRRAVDGIRSVPPSSRLPTNKGTPHLARRGQRRKRCAVKWELNTPNQTPTLQRKISCTGICSHQPRGPWVPAWEQFIVLAEASRSGQRTPQFLGLVLRGSEHSCGKEKGEFEYKEPARFDATIIGFEIYGGRRRRQLRSDGRPAAGGAGGGGRAEKGRCVVLIVLVVIRACVWARAWLQASACGRDFQETKGSKDAVRTEHSSWYTKLTSSETETRQRPSPPQQPLARSAPPLPPRTVYRHQESVAHQTVPCIASGRTRRLYRIGTSRASIGPGTTPATRAAHTIPFIKPGVSPLRDAYAYHGFRSTGAGMTSAGERCDAKQERKKTTRSSPRRDGRGLRAAQIAINTLAQIDINHPPPRRAPHLQPAPVRVGERRYIQRACRRSQIGRLRACRQIASPAPSSQRRGGDGRGGGGTDLGVLFYYPDGRNTQVILPKRTLPLLRLCTEHPNARARRADFHVPLLNSQIEMRAQNIRGPDLSNIILISGRFRHSRISLVAQSVPSVRLA
ncbi:hypothetical protein C8J57DRAFT_1225915 [Mycena rebaudengoi]|nr:hypothetical protein C8J57DRAFT_1225915 [Mycena rebaudengoi]